MYRIAVLTDRTRDGRNYVEQITRFCMSRGLLPQIELHNDQERFFHGILDEKPSCIVLALPGVAGLNAVEHLRSLCPDCGIMWCSDLDFSLQAFRLRIEYFLLEPITPEAFSHGLTVLFETHMKRNRN
ncbi:MAG TPA: response regulator [Candidatus Fimimorpha faecalis]|uniref:Response regulator n=1 Tax=Candidatus Fimimorpha faecalis TaxID=2840824 RepID=A0A9D1EGZ6_9FIRM|nr:response regulator [Candidatus Fimimorpha faecalis]